jgi:hypothetical protein
MNLTYEERMLMAICSTGSREGLIDKLVDMRSYLEPEGEELIALIDSAVGKLEAMTDEAFALLDLTPDYDEEEEPDAG